jgi:hypothetical protein
MHSVTMHVLEGVDKGTVHRNLRVPLSIGREEGNSVRLNDDRISRYHAKIVLDGHDLVLADLDSTNGTRVNGQPVQIRRLLPGDRIHLGRSLLLIGTPQEIEERLRLNPSTKNHSNTVKIESDLKSTPTIGPDLLLPESREKHLTAPWGDLTIAGGIPWDKFGQAPFKVESGNVFHGPWELPPLPEELSPSQAARLAELLDFLHWNMSMATEAVKISETGEVRLKANSWIRLQAVQMAMARYIRAAGNPASSDNECTE